MDYEEYMRKFNAKAVKDGVVSWIRQWFETNGNGCNAVVGISGGKDSSVVAALCVEALGKERVVGVLMPNHEQADIGSAYKLVDHLGIMYTVVNIGGAVDYLSSHVDSSILRTAKLFSSQVSLKMSVQSKTNLPCRIRMATLYAVSQSVNGRVANTCNLSEDWVGYSTRYGDSVGDFSPLSMLTTDEVIAIGKECGIPNELIEKVPSDGLCGKTDEENLGFSYRVLNEYIRTGHCDDERIRALIDEKHSKSLFKLLPMPVFLYEPIRITC